MLELLNSVALAVAPGIRQQVKPAFNLWCRSKASLLTPVRKTIAGSRFWCHPRFLPMNLDNAEPHVTTWLQERLKPGATFLDVGANHGLHSMPCARIVGKRGRVIAFEPSPENLKVLRYHKTINRLSQIQIDNRPVSERDEDRVPFYLLDGGDQASNSLTIGGKDVPYMEGHSREPLYTKTVSLDDYCRQNKLAPNVVKIDVEGAELMVLRGAQQILRSIRPSVILAVHPFWLPPGQTPAELCELLRANGYLILDSKGKACHELEYAEYLCVPE